MWISSDGEDCYDSNLEEWMTEESMASLPNFAKNNSRHLCTRKKTYTYPGGYDCILPERYASQPVSCSHQGYRKYSRYSAGTPEEYCSSIQRQSMQPLSPKDEYILLIPRSGRGQSKENTSTNVLHSPVFHY